MANQGSSDRGFASMDEDKQREIARKGGESVPDEKRSFSRDPQLAAEAGREGGQQSGGRDQGGQQGGGQRGRENGQQAQDEGRQGVQQRGGQGGGEGQQGGNFANDRERASEAGRKGGQS